MHFWVIIRHLESETETYDQLTFGLFPMFRQIIGGADFNELSKRNERSRIVFHHQQPQQSKMSRATKNQILSMKLKFEYIFG